MSLLFEKKNREIIQALQLVCGIVEKKQVHPILANVCIEKVPQGLSFMTSDVSMQAQAIVAHPVTVQIPAITVGAKKLLDFLKSHEEDATVRLVYDQPRLIVTVKCGRYTLQTLSADNFPRMNEHFPTPGISLKVSQRQLRCQLLRIYYAMSHQDFRSYLNGAFFEIDHNVFHVVATDVHRLSHTQTQLTEDSMTGHCIIPRKAILELIRLLKEVDEVVCITLHATQACFQLPSVLLVTKLVEGRYPDYKGALVTDYAHMVIVDRYVLLRAIQRVSILTSEKLKGIRFILSIGLLRIFSVNTENEEAQEELCVDYQGRDVDVAYNAVYLTEALQCLDCEVVYFEISPSNNSLRITGTHREDFQHYVMPMRI